MQIQESVLTWLHPLNLNVTVAMYFRDIFFTADKMNFLRLADLLNIQVVTVNIKRHPLEAWMPQLYQSSASLWVRKVVRHRQVGWSQFFLKWL